MRATQERKRVLTKRGPLEGEMARTPLFLLQESYEQYEKAKGYDMGR